MIIKWIEDTQFWANPFGVVMHNMANLKDPLNKPIPNVWVWTSESCMDPMMNDRLATQTDTTILPSPKELLHPPHCNIVTQSLPQITK